jgi:hypothetical protein
LNRVLNSRSSTRNDPCKASLLTGMTIMSIPIIELLTLLSPGCEALFSSAEVRKLTGLRKVKLKGELAILTLSKNPILKASENLISILCVEMFFESRGLPRESPLTKIICQ